MRTALFLAVLVTVRFLDAAPAYAGAFTGPTDVNAQPDGSYNFQAIYVAGPGDEIVNSFSFFGVANTGDGIHYDCGCGDFGSPCSLPAGMSATVPVSGTLIDRTMNGVVEETFATCGSGSATFMTTIHPAVVAPPPPPPIPATTPGARAALVIALLAAGAAIVRRRGMSLQ
jgi:hypothetical protein